MELSLSQRKKDEPVSTSLARIEGLVSGVAKDINNVLDKVNDVRGTSDRHELVLNHHSAEIQQLQSDARAAEKGVKDADKAREETAAALEKQTSEMVRKAKDAVEQSTQHFTPWMRLATMLGGMASIAGTVYYLNPHH